MELLYLTDFTYFAHLNQIFINWTSCISQNNELLSGYFAFDVCFQILANLFFIMN